MQPAQLLATDFYAGLTPAYIKLDSSAGAISHEGVGVQLGVGKQAHNLELMHFQATGDDTLNVLTSELASSTSIFYRYDFSPIKYFKVFFILGASSTDVETSYAAVATTSESYSGTSYGLGFEDVFAGHPDLKLKLDVINLYSGDDIDIYTIQFGLRYVF